MCKYIALVCSLAVLPSLRAQTTPKGKETGLIQRVSAIDAAAVRSITPESVAGYERASDNTRFTVLHILTPGAPAVQVSLENVRLPAGGALLVYGQGNAPAWVYKSGSEESPIVEGESAFIEVQCGVECPSDLPFDLIGVEPAAVPDRVTDVVSSKGTTTYRGVEVEYEVRDGVAIVEGDIVLGPAHEMVPSAMPGKNREKQAFGVSNTSQRWPDGRVPYAIDFDVPNQLRVTSAISHWNTMLGGAIQFIPRTNESTYLRIMKGSSCYSTIGMSWMNTTYLADSCQAGNVIHELGHVLGLEHEHIRVDRNQHVRINTGNITVSSLFNFLQIFYGTDDIGPYDFNSIMHYGAFSFSANGQATIETIPAGIPIGQRKALSSGDIAAVRKMYGYGYNVPAPVPSDPAPKPTTDPDPEPKPTPEPTPDPKPEPPPPPPVVKPFSVTVSANPTSEQIVVDGESYTGSATFQWNPGSSHSIGAVSRQGGGSAATFVRWSDSGAATHVVVASTSEPIYKADFALGYQVSATTSSSGGGTVSLSPNSTTGYYPAYTSLDLVATPASGYCFNGWSGLIGGTPAETTLSVTKPYAVSAGFIRASVTLDNQVVYAKSKKDHYTVGVTSPDDCSWTAISQAPWIKVAEAGGKRMGKGKLTLEVDANEAGFFRVGMVSIDGRFVYVVQYP